MKVLRFDRGELRKPEKMPNGWMRVDGYLGRAGILEYPRADGSVRREYRPPEEAFHADSLASFDMVPFTNSHPPTGLLDAENTKMYQVGTVGTPHKDGDKVRASILITDSSTIADMQAGKVELSMGYWAECDETPGEIDGERYDAIQRNVRGNHVALVRAGRAGPEVRIRVDSLNAEVVPSDSHRIGKPDSRGQAMVKIRIDGVEVEVPETAAQLIQKSEKGHADVAAQLQAKADAAVAQAAKDAARADAAEAKVKKLEAEAAVAPAKLREELTARVALETQAREVLGTEAKFDGKTDLQVKAEVAAKVLEVKLDGKADAYVEAMYDIALKQHQDAPSAIDQVRAGTLPIERADDSDPVAKAKAEFYSALKQ